MDELMCNLGLDFLASDIFDLLDISSLMRCRLVCRNWRHFIDRQKFTWAKMLTTVTTSLKMKKWLSSHKIYNDFVMATAANGSCLENTKKLAILLSSFEPSQHISPLHLSSSRKDSQSVMFLLQRLGLNPMEPLVQDPGGNTPAHLCAKDTEVVKYLISSGKVEIFSQARNSLGQTPFHLAAAAGNLGALKVMANHNTEDEVNPADNEGTTPLHEACRFGHRLVVRYLLSQIGGDKNPIKKDGSTALHCAALHGDTKIIQLLLTYGGGCSVTTGDKNGCLNALLHIVNVLPLIEIGSP